MRVNILSAARFSVAITEVNILKKYIVCGAILKYRSKIVLPPFTFLEPPQAGCEVFNKEDSLKSEIRTLRGKMFRIIPPRVYFLFFHDGKVEEVLIVQTKISDPIMKTKSE